MSLVDTFAIYRHEPFTGPTWADDVWAIPVRVEEELTGYVRLRDERAVADDDRLQAAIEGAHPWLRPLARETGHVRLVEVFEPVSEQIHADAIGSALRFETSSLVRQGAWISGSVSLYQIRLEPYWSLIDDSEAGDMGLQDPGIQKDVQAFLDAGFEGQQVGTADRGVILHLEALTIDLWQLPAYVASLSARRRPDTLCIRLWASEDRLPSLPSFISSTIFQAALKSRGLGWLIPLWDVCTRGVMDLPPGSPDVPEGVRASFGQICRAFRSQSVAPAFLNDSLDIQPPLGRSLLVPGLYPDGWTSPRVPYRSLRHAWAQLVAVYDRFGLSYDNAPPMPPA